MLEKVKAEIGDLYPPIPDPAASGDELGSDSQGTMGFAEDPQQKLKVKRGFLTPWRISGHGQCGAKIPRAARPCRW